jgi:hypothetical protein
MVLPQATTVTDSHQGDAQRLGILVHDLLHVERHTAGALVQDGVPRLMVKETGHGDALLETTGEDVTPLGFGVPAFGVELEDILEVEDAQNGEKVSVGDALGAHSADAVGVDDLLTEGAAGEVGALGDVEDIGEGGLVDGAAVYGPETAEDAEEGRFATAVGADDEQMVALFERERECLDEDIAVGGDDRAIVLLAGANSKTGEKRTHR